MPGRESEGRMFEPGELEKINKEAGGEEVPTSESAPREAGEGWNDDDDTESSIPAGAFEEPNETKKAA